MHPLEVQGTTLLSLMTQSKKYGFIVWKKKKKFDVFEIFKKWKAMVETETDLKVKCLRLNNGGEYIDGGFNEYCAIHGIMMEKTIPRTP